MATFSHSMRFFWVLLCLAMAAFAEPGACSFNPRQCADHNDSTNAARLPDSLQISLQAKLDNDTGFVFWGVLEENGLLAIESYENGSIQAWFHNSISAEQKAQFLAWYNDQYNAALQRLDSIPPDMKNTFVEASKNALYALTWAKYTVEKIYDKKTRTWKKPSKDSTSITRYYLVHRGPVVNTQPPKLLHEVSQIIANYTFRRIFFEDGYSKIIEQKEFDSLGTFASKPGTYLPGHYTLEVSKDMSAVYKRRIIDALGRGDKDAIRENMVMLDSFLVYANNRFFYSWPTSLTCPTRQLMNAYLLTFEDGLDCNKPSYDDELEKLIFATLRDSITTMYNSGKLEKELAQHSSGNRAFWRVIGGTLATTDQDERNQLVKENADSIQNVEQRNFIVNSFYKEITIGKISAEIGLGGGLSVPLGKARDYFPIDWTPVLQIDFFYKRFGGATIIRSMKTDNLTDSTFINSALLDYAFGFKTLALPHLEHRIFAGPTLIFTSLRNENQNKAIDEEFSLGFNVATALDFYVTPTGNRAYSSDAPIDKSLYRLGFRLQTGCTYYNVQMIEANGGNYYLSLSLIIQEYSYRLKKYGE